MGCDCEKTKPEVVEEVPTSRLAINCYCGLARMIPTGLKVGDTFSLVPCPKCGSTFIGKFVGNGVQT